MKTLASSLLIAAALSANAYAGSNEVDTPIISTLQQNSSPAARADAPRGMKEQAAQQTSVGGGQSTDVRATGNAAGGQVKK